MLILNRNRKKTCNLTFVLLGKSVKNKFLFTMTAYTGQTWTTLGQLCATLWVPSPDPQKVIQLHHQKHPDRLHHLLVWQLLGIWHLGATEDSEYGPVHHWCQASCHPWPKLRKKRNVLSLSTSVILSKLDMCTYLYEHNKIQQLRHKLNKFHRHVTNINFIMCPWTKGR